MLSGDYLSKSVEMPRLEVEVGEDINTLDTTWKAIMEGQGKAIDTFSDRVSLRREKSMTQEELNQRAEAFIKKFNNDMRLQRLESDQRRFREIVNGGL
ncbi:uncharacterized protein Pyn_23637 [Prunus yedoensis var. nudiflora]|uniref:Uncharacterized protein n=1 Tax=Prunus yedoensis var. nudiflora TaxID=2094558 RepID=A0A314YEM2_PRUYE|nr:uncharacterized protein Pyn_23637 [Prunus yedoensis var. nudiflora]